MSRTVLVTGVSRHLGACVARDLARHHDVARVIGLDVVPPAEELGRAEFVRADVRNPVVGRLLNQAHVDTVVHLSLSTWTTQGRARSSQKEENVIGTMQLFAACQQAADLQRIVLKSTGSVYGSSPRDPAMFTEDQTAPRARAHGTVRDALEVEGYLRATRRRRPDLEFTTLRLAHVVGPHVSSPLMDFFALPIVPIPLGYDARLQLLHEDDATMAIVTAVVGPAAGVVNIAAPGVLTLTQAVALAGRPFVLVPTYSGLTVGRLVRMGKLTRFGRADLDYLRFGRVLDTTRARDLLDFTPEYTTRQAYLEAVEAFAPTVPGVAAVRGWAGALTAALTAGVSLGGEAAPEDVAGEGPQQDAEVDLIDLAEESGLDGGLDGAPAAAGADDAVAAGLALADVEPVDLPSEPGHRAPARRPRRRPVRTAPTASVRAEDGGTG